MTDAPQRRGEPERQPPMGAAQPRRVDVSSLVVAALLAIAAAVVVWDASRLPAARGYAGMGPADTARVVALGLFVLAIWAAWDAIRTPAEPSPPQNVPALLWIVGGLGLQLVLLTSAGFSIASGLLFAAVAAAFGRPKLWMTIPIGIAFALAVYGIFALLLKLSLPAGPLERLVFGA